MNSTIPILVYFGDNGNEYWLVDTPVRRDAALIALFKLIDNFGCYVDEEVNRLALARAGNLRAVRAILESRRRCEYEKWEIEYVRVVE